MDCQYINTSKVITKHSPSNLHYIALLYSNLIGQCYTNRLSAPSIESSAAAQRKTCLPRTGVKKIKLKTKLDTTHTNTARQLTDFARTHLVLLDLTRPAGAASSNNAFRAIYLSPKRSITDSSLANSLFFIHLAYRLYCAFVIKHVNYIIYNELIELEKKTVSRPLSLFQ